MILQISCTMLCEIFDSVMFSKLVIIKKRNKFNIMQLEAVLTPDWPVNSHAKNSSRNLVNHAEATTVAYQESLTDALKKHDISSIVSLEQLFRRKPAGFDPLKKFLSTLTSIDSLADKHDKQKSQTILSCSINAFAYAFLKAAKNIDFILPLAKSQPTELLHALSQWQASISALEHFERTGKRFPPTLCFNKDDYLAVRTIITRPSARDERSTIAALLLSGPSCIDDICTDLGINTSLSQRILSAFSQSRLLKKDSEKKFSIKRSKIPIALFCLRETMGLDPLSMLSIEK